MCGRFFCVNFVRSHPSPMRHFLIIAAVLCTACFASAQKPSETEAVLRNLQSDAPTYDGRIFLANGTEEKGTVSYNDATAVVSFKSDSKSGTYNARNLSGFEFFDDDQEIKRSFFSMEYEMRDGGSRTSQFFEIVRQYKDFAIIIKTDPLSIKKKTGVVEAAVLGNYERTRVIVSNAMTVYFINEDLSVRPYLEVSSKEVSHINKLWGWDIFAGESSKVRILDHDLPKQLMGEHYKKVVAFMRERKMHWDNKDDLLAILDYYDSLVDQ